MPSYTLCLVVHESTLHRIAELVGTEYVPGSIEHATAAMEDRDDWETDFELAGPRGRYVVRIERYEGYLWCTLHGDGPEFQQGKELMWADYLHAGGNTAAVKDPWS